MSYFSIMKSKPPQNDQQLINTGGSTQAILKQFHQALKRESATLQRDIDVLDKKIVAATMLAARKKLKDA